MALHTVGQMSLDGAWKSSITAWPGSSTISSKTLKVGFPRQWGSGFQRLNIRCARIEGVELPNKKRIETALQSIHGVGKTTARQILLTIGLENKVTSELSELELTKIREELSNYMIEGKLRRFNALNIQRLVDIQCYRGRRHRAGLPVRGQRTKCNARTRKRAVLGKKRVVAGKKKTTKRWVIRGATCHVWFTLAFARVGDKAATAFGFRAGALFDVNNMPIFLKRCHKGSGLLEIAGFRG